MGNGGERLLGPKEVAELLNVVVPTVHEWRRRQRLPEPHAVISGVPIWRHGEIVKWAKQTGRWPEGK